jgi:hypothetical protein
MAKTYTDYELYCLDEWSNLQRDIPLETNDKDKAKQKAKKIVTDMKEDDWRYKHWSFELHLVTINADNGDIITDKFISRV